MLNAINSWIKSGCDYLQGVALYDQYGTDDYLKRHFKRSTSNFNRQKLHSALVALRDAAAPPAPVAPPVPVSPAEPVRSTTLPKLLQVTKERDTNYAEIRGLHVHLAITDEGEDLRELAERIVRLGKRNALLWQQYNYLTENPESAAPDEPEVVPVLVDINLINTAESIRKSLSKAKKRAAGQNPPNQATLDLIRERTRQLADLRAQIAALKNGGAA